MNVNVPEFLTKTENPVGEVVTQYAPSAVGSLVGVKTTVGALVYACENANEFSVPPEIVIWPAASCCVEFKWLNSVNDPRPMLL